MSTVDDELTRRFQGAERPVDADDLVEGLRRRRAHREHVRKAQASALAFAVLVGTAGGFMALAPRSSGTVVPLATSATPCRRAARSCSLVEETTTGSIFAARPDGSGVRQITDDLTNDTDPTVSPDGTTIAFVHELDQGIRVIGTVPIDGGTVTWLTDEELDAHDPAWSPDGDRLAFVGASQFHGFPVKTRSSSLPDPVRLPTRCSTTPASTSPIRAGRPTATRSRSRPATSSRTMTLRTTG